MKKQLISIVIMLAIFVSLTVLPANAVAPLKLTVSNVTAEPGSEVSVTVSVSDNPGLASLKFDVEYDSYLTLTKVEFDSAFGSMVTAPEPFKNPEPLTMISPLADVKANGTFAILTFKVADNVPSDYKAEVNLSYLSDDIYDGNFDEVSVEVINGSVTINSAQLGDLNGDKKINVTDIFVLKSFFSGSLRLTEAQMQAGDISGEGQVNLADMFMLKNYIITGKFN